jgi:hypothetical protein
MCGSKDYERRREILEYRNLEEQLTEDETEIARALVVPWAIPRLEKRVADHKATWALRELADLRDTPMDDEDEVV